jgi:hypothetical protein
MREVGLADLHTQYYADPRFAPRSPSDILL